MTKANTQVIAKVAAIVAGAGLVLSAFAYAIPASAQTTTTTTTTTTSASACASFNRDLTIGSTGADVTALQTWLISKGYSIPAGATGYFGGQTQAAVAQYQAASGITPAAGYFGPITRAYHASHCGTTTDDDSDDDDDDDSDDDDSDDDSDDDLEGGEADLSDFELNDEDGEGSEGEEMVEIATLEFDVEDGDVLVERVEFIASSTNLSLEQQPWDYFDTLYLLDEDGDEVAEVDASDRDEWDEEDDDEVYRIVFTDVDHLVNEDDRAELTLAGDIAGSIDTADQAQEFEFYVPDDGVRAVDSEDIQHYIPNGDSEEVTFGFDEEETGEINIESSSDDPDNMTLISDEDDESDEYTVFVFDIENEDEEDVEILEITIDIDSSVDGDDLFQDATLMVDGEEYDGDIAADSIVFEDLDLELAGEDTLTFELVVTLEAGAADTTVTFSLDDTDVEAEGVDSGDESDISGSATSEEHTISETGIMVEGVSTEDDANEDDTVGTFEITFEVTADEDDLYIYQGADNASSTTSGVIYTIYQNGNATSTFFGTANDLLQSDAEESANGLYFVVEEGETEEFTLTVTLDPTTAGLYFVELNTVRFDPQNAQDTSAEDDTHFDVPDDSEFETDARQLDAS